MANYEQLKTAVNTVIRTNGNNEITGKILQSTLLSIINSVVTGSIFAGIATPSTNPGTPDANVFYLAMSSGIYSNFGGYVVGDNVVLFENKSGNWVGTNLSISIAGMLSVNYLTPQSINGLYYTDGHFAANANWRTTGQLDTTVNKQFNIKVTVIGTAQAIAGWDASGNFVSLQVGTFNGTYTVPDNIVKIAVTTQATAGIDYYCYGGITVLSLVNSIANYSNQIDAINSIIGTLPQQNILTADSINGYYNASGTLIATANWRTTGKVTKTTSIIDVKNVIEGIAIGVSGWKADNTYVVIQAATFSGKITLPDDIVYFQVSSRSLVGDVYYCYLVKTIGEMLGSETATIQLLQTQLDYNTANRSENKLTFNSETGYYLADGTKSSGANWRTTGRIEVVAGELIQVVNVISGTIAIGLGGWDASGNFIVIEQTTFNGTYTVPDNIVAIQVSTRALATDVFSCYITYNKTIGQWILELRENVAYLLSVIGSIGANRNIVSFVPPTTYAVIGEQLRIYPYNLIAVNDNDLSVDVWLNKQYANEEASFLANPQANETLTYKLRNYDGNNVTLGTTNLQVLSPSNPTSKLFALCIGDSLTEADNGIWVNEFSRLLTGVGDSIPNGNPAKAFSNIQVIGTLGNRPVKHEGRGGWTLYNYLNTQANNAFYNPAKSKFDLDYYLNQNGFYTQGVAANGSNLIITIMLNWNSVYNHTDAQFTGWYNELLGLIHTSHPQARCMIVGINTPPSKNYKSYTGNRNISRAGIMLDCIRFEKMIQAIATNASNSSFTKHIPLLPFFCADESYPTLTTVKKNLRSSNTTLVYTDYVHPNTTGYGQIADIVYRAFCSYLV